MCCFFSHRGEKCQHFPTYYLRDALAPLYTFFTAYYLRIFTCFILRLDFALYTVSEITIPKETTKSEPASNRGDRFGFCASGTGAHNRLALYANHLRKLSQAL